MMFIVANTRRAVGPFDDVRVAALYAVCLPIDTDGGTYVVHIVEQPLARAEEDDR